MKLNTYQRYYFFAFIFVAFLLAGAAYIQVYQGVSPCALCIVQRAIFIVLGCLFLFGILLARWSIGRILIGIMSTLFSLAGVLTAGRHVWMQHQPQMVGANCEVSLDFMLEVFPLSEVIKKVFIGGGECSQVGWEFLQISLAEWSLSAFIILLFFSVWQLRKRA